MRLRRQAHPEHVRAIDRARYYRDRAKRLALSRRIRQSDPVRHTAYTRAWRRRNPEKYRAQNAVNNAIRDGKLERGPCEQAGSECSARVTAHHDDYAKPLVVRWLCTFHHGLVHRG